MVGLFFGELSTLDVVMALFTGLIGSATLAIAYKMAHSGAPKWQPRKFVHVTMGSVIGLTIVAYSNLSGPALAIGIFLVVLAYAWAHRSTLVTELLVAGSRDGETGRSTFLAGTMGLFSFAFAFLLFLPRPEVFTAAILSVSWADGSGEVFGRAFGGRYIKRPLKGKSFEGSSAVFLFSALSMMVSLGLYSDICPFCVAPQILFIAFAVAIAELLSRKWLDNLVLPLLTSVLMWLLLFPQTPLFGLFQIF